MLNPAFNKKFLFGTTVMAGFAALTVMSSPAYAQSGSQGTPIQPTDQPAPQPGVSQPNSDDDTTVDGEETAAQGVDTTQAGEDEGTVEAVVVTGSRIRRDPTNAPTPLIQLNREEILQSGEPNVIDYLADIPALQNSVVPEDTTGASLGTGGLSLLNLRNLGVARTLTLVDGRRHVGAAYFSPSAVDVDTIPRLLIQNVEVITGGSSAVYGADAVSGVVNFVLRRDFEGLEVDTSLAQINQDGQLSYRVSALAGQNLLDDRLNVYVTGEYEHQDEVQDSDIDFFRDGRALYQNDLDPTSPLFGRPSDGVLDVLTGRNFGSLGRAPGGALVLVNELRPSPATDPDLPSVSCSTAVSVPNSANFPGSCFTLDPGFGFVFDQQGVARPVNFGSFRVPAGQIRTLVVGSPDALPLTAFRASRLPPTDAYRVQTGFNFDVTDDVQLFGEIKYAREESENNFQPAFFGIGIRPFPTATTTQTFTGFGGSFDIGLDNAFLDPALRTLITNNRRVVYDQRATIVVGGQTVPNPNFGQPVASVADARALLQNFAFELGTRSQLNERETTRYVLGARGGRDRLGFINNFTYELGYTYGEVEDTNLEPDVVDAERYAFAADAVRDVNNVTGKGANSIVCRVQLQTANGGTIQSNIFGDVRTLNAQSPQVAGCVPIRIFGLGGVSQEAINYILTTQNTQNRITQQDALAFASGELWDFWGAGPIGVAVGLEYREESFSTEFNSPAEGDVPERRNLFANLSSDFPEARFNVSEVFGEIRVPLLRDLPLADSLEVSAAYRRSEYSTIGKSEAFSVQASYRPSRDILFRATYGKAVRTPNLVELFRPANETFSQITDPCSRTVIDNTQDVRIRNNRITNCAALGVPASFVDPNPTSSNGGFLGGNPGLEEEEGTSYTLSTVITPRFARGLSFVIDYYNLEIDNAIASLSAQAIVSACFDLDAPNPSACANIRRDPTTFEINYFLSSPVNFAGLRAQGIDFAARYGLELGDLDFINRDIGRLDFSIRGNYNIRRQDFINPTDPGFASNIDSTLGNPRVRFLTGVTYSVANLGLTWEVDYQTEQELFDDSLFLTNPDSREPDLITSEAFTQHDFSLRYDLNDAIRLRAGVVNAFDAEPSVQVQDEDIFDLFGRRFYIGLNYKLGQAQGQRR